MNDRAPGAWRNNADLVRVGSYHDEETGNVTPIYLDLDSSVRLRRRFMSAKHQTGEMHKTAAAQGLFAIL